MSKRHALNFPGGNSRENQEENGDVNTATLTLEGTSANVLNSNKTIGSLTIPISQLGQRIRGLNTIYAICHNKNHNSFI